MKALRLGIAGLGTVGGGLVRRLRAHADLVAAHAGRRIEVAAVSARSRCDRGLALDGAVWHDDARTLARADVDVVVELIGGSGGVALELVEQALACGRHVVTANKALVARHGVALAALAEQAGVAFTYEAAVAGGIPVIKTLRSLAANPVVRVCGILNGTCNYVLDEMERTGCEYAAALGQAQHLGYAEADPALDVGGMDAAHKVCILAALAFGGRVALDDVCVEGIEAVTGADIGFAQELGYCIRQVAEARLAPAGLEQGVQAMLTPAGSILARVTGAGNAVVIEGQDMGRVALSGPGAGEGPTAAAVISDVVDIARGLRLPVFAVAHQALAAHPPAPWRARRAAFYLRLHVADRPGAMAAVTRVLGAAGVSIRQMHQPSTPRHDGASPAHLPVVIMSHMTDGDSWARAMADLAGHEAIAGAPLALRIHEP